MAEPTADQAIPQVPDGLQGEPDGSMGDGEIQPTDTGAVGVEEYGSPVDGAMPA